MAFEFNDANAHEIIESGKPVMIDFWATWCGPCMAMSPIVDELAKEYDGRVVIGKYNVDNDNDLATEFRIMSIPAFVFFKDGKRFERLSGSQSRDTLVELIEKMLK